MFSLSEVTATQAPGLHQAPVATGSGTSAGPTGSTPDGTAASQGNNTTGRRRMTPCLAAWLTECARELREIQEAMAATERELLEIQAVISANDERP